MRVGINTRSILGSKMEGFGNYSFELVSRLTAAHPEHTFILYFDRKIDVQFKFSNNVECRVLFPPTRHPILYIIWFQWRLKKAIRKDLVDVFWSPDGMFPLKKKIPVLATIHDLNFEHYPKDLPRLVAWYYKKYFPRFAQQSDKIITVSKTTKQDIITTYEVEENKIAVVYNGVNTRFKPLTDENKREIQKQFDKPFFIFVGSLHPRKNIHKLLEAFEIFTKTDSQSELLIVGASMWKNETFKLSDELAGRIKFLGHVPTDNLALLMAGATALVYVPYFEGFGMPLAEAMASSTPIIAGNKSCLPEIAHNAALYVDPFNHLEIADAMTLIKNDVALQSKLIQAGKERLKDFSWDLAAQQVWNEIENLVS